MRPYFLYAFLNAGIFLVDVFAPVYYPVWVLYLVPILYALGNFKRGHLTVLLINTVLAMGGHFSFLRGRESEVMLINRSVDVAAFWLFWLLIYRDKTKAKKIRAQSSTISDLDAAKRDIEEILKRYRQLTELSPDAIFIHGDWKIVYANPAGLRLFGAKDAGEIIGRDVLDFVHPEFKEFVGNRIKQSYEEKLKSPLAESRVIRLDGRAVDVEAVSTPIDYKGRPATQFVLRDITERKRAEEELQKENRVIAFANRILEVFVKEAGDEMYDKALDIVLEGMESRHGVFGYIDEHGDLMCPTMSKLFDQCEIEGKCICYTRDKWKGLWSRALLEQKTLYSNKPAMVPSGHVPIRNNMATPILFQGNVIGLFNLANKDSDYTEEDREFIESIGARIAPVLFAWIQKEIRENERKKAEEKIAHLASFPEINPNPILELEPDENISYINPAMRVLFPDLPEKGLAHALLDGWKEISEKAKQEETHALTREVRTADRIYHQSIYYFPEMGLWRIYHLDITERKLAEEQINSSLREKEILLKELYHRTKNNMHVISSLLGLQLASYGDESIKKLVKETQNRIKAMSLVHEKLYASRDLSHLDMKGYIEDLAHGIFAACKEDSKRVLLDLRLESLPLSIEMAVPVGLILNELISNSLKHAFPEGRGGEIRISLGSSGGRIRLEYGDNGTGIDGDFEALGKKSLGLKIVSTLVKQLEGEMRVVNNKGAVFIFSFSGEDKWQRSL